MTGNDWVLILWATSPFWVSMLAMGLAIAVFEK